MRQVLIGDVAYLYNDGGDLVGVTIGRSDVPVATPRKPTPALPAEVHSATAFDADRAHDALVALCRGG